MRDADGDATLDANGRVSRSLRNLDIRACSIAKRGERLRLTMKITDLRSLAPHGSTRDRDAHLVWLVQWFSPSKTDPHGGEDLFAYMESAQGHRPSSWVGQTAGAVLPTSAPGFTYPGITRVRGSFTRTSPGTIRITVPLKAAFARNRSAGRFITSPRAR